MRLSNVAIPAGNQRLDLTGVCPFVLGVLLILVSATVRPPLPPCRLSRIVWTQHAADSPISTHSVQWKRWSLGCDSLGLRDVLMLLRTILSLSLSS